MITTYFKNLIMDNVWNTAANAAELPQHLFVGYSTTEPALDGTSVSEPTAATGYARVTLDGMLGAAANGVVSNTAQVSMPETTADQGTVTHYVIYDALTGGNLLAGGKLKNSRIMEIESALLFKVGDIKITLEDKAEASA